MARACSLGPLLVLLLATVSVSLPVTVVRLNKAMLDYGKRPANMPPSVEVRTRSEWTQVSQRTCMLLISVVLGMGLRT